MKYTVQSTKYVIKNFPYLFPLAILPALFLSVSTDEESIRCVLQTLLSGELGEISFSRLFRAISILNFASGKSIIAGAIGIVVTVFCGSLFMAYLEKHMRIGKRTFNGMFTKLNDNLLTTCFYVLLLLAIYEVWALLLAVLLFFITKIAVAFLAYLFMAILFLGMHVVLLYAVGIIYLWLPCMQITGFKASDALYYSNQLVAPVKWKILSGQLVLLLFTEASLCLCAVFSHNMILFIALATVIYCILIMIYCVRMQVAYFDLDNIERADLAYYYQR